MLRMFLQPHAQIGFCQLNVRRQSVSWGFRSVNAASTQLRAPCCCLSNKPSSTTSTNVSEPSIPQPVDGADVNLKATGSPTLKETWAASSIPLTVEGNTGHISSRYSEIRKILLLSLPLAAGSVLSYGASVVSSASVGQLGAQQLASTVVAQSLFNTTGLSIVLGLAAGMDTLCGQRALLLVTCVSLGLGCLWTQSEGILRMLGQDPTLAASASQYLLMITPVLVLSGASECLRKYQLTQGVVWPGFLASAATTLLAPLFYWAMLSKLQWGLAGAAVASIGCSTTSLLMLMLATAWRHHSMGSAPTQTWGGFNMTSAMQDWRQYLSFALPAAAMICLEWWAFEALIFMAGNLPNADLAVSAMGISTTMTTLAYMLPLGIGAATNTCVANAIGAGEPRRAKTAIVSAAVLAMGCQAVTCSAMVLNGENIVRFFTSDPGVVAATLPLVPLLACMTFVDSLNPVLGGALRGAGRQALGAAVNLVGYYGFGLPLAYWLGCVQGWGVSGFWVGMGLSVSLQALSVGTVLMRTDWGRQRVTAVVAAAAKA